MLTDCILTDYKISAPTQNTGEPDFYKIFSGFDPEAIARFTSKKIENITQDARIIRNKLKVNAIVINAKSYLAFQKNSKINFSKFLWNFVDGQPLINDWGENKSAPASMPASEAMSKALKKLGFKFVGPTICYAFMQAAGMVDDHDSDCFKKESFF